MSRRRTDEEVIALLRTPTDPLEQARRIFYLATLHLDGNLPPVERRRLEFEAVEAIGLALALRGDG